MTEIHILAIPNAKGAELRDLNDHLRPFAKEHNIILTTTDVKTVSLENFEIYLENLLAVVKGMKKPEPPFEPVKELSKEEQERVDKEVTEILKKEGRL